MIRKNMVFLWVTALLPLLLCLWFYPQLPELIPTNFNNGEITKYGPKATIWIIGGLGPVIALLFTLLPMVDPLQRNRLETHPSHGRQALVCRGTGAVPAGAFPAGENGPVRTCCGDLPGAGTGAHCLLLPALAAGKSQPRTLIPRDSAPSDTGDAFPGSAGVFYWQIHRKAGDFFGLSTALWDGKMKTDRAARRLGNLL